MYSNIADWRAYALARGDQAPTDATDTDANAALTRASDYIRTRYVIRLAPAFADDSAEVVEATHIAASLDLASPGFWAKTYTQAQTKVLTKVGSIAWTPLQGGAALGTQRAVDQNIPTSPAIEALFVGARAYDTAMFVV